MRFMKTAHCGRRGTNLHSRMPGKPTEFMEIIARKYK